MGGVSFRYLILGLLRGGAKLHGYALVKEYRERAGVDVGSGNFYREIQRLIGEGLIRCTEKLPGVDARRLPYEITEPGIAAFDAWFADPSGWSANHCDDEMSARVLFIGSVEPAVVATVLDRWQEDLWYRGKALERQRQAAIAARRRAPGDFRALSLLLTRRLKHIAADVEFLEEFRAAYAEWVAVHHPAAAQDQLRGPPRRRQVDLTPMRAARRA